MSKPQIEAIQTPMILTMPNLNEQLKQTVMNTSLYTEAEMVSMNEMNILLGDTLSTNHWDTVSICRVSALNEWIKEKETYPKTIVETYDDSGDIYKIDGTFKPWSIAVGGDGKNVNVGIALDSGTFNAGGKDYSLAGTNMKVQVKLNYFPMPDPKQPKNGSYDLKVRTASQGPDDPVASIVVFNAPSGMSILLKSALQFIIQDWLNKEENLKKFDTLFSTVVINNIGEKEDYQWLKPTYMSYAYTDLGSDTSSIFGVLCMTNNRSADDAPHQLPVVSLKDDYSSVFLINREIFVKYQFLPALPETFPDAVKENFELDADGLNVTARNLKLEAVSYGAIDYHPVLRSLNVTFNETQINTITIIDTNISPGIDVTTTIVTNQTLSMGHNKDNEPIMQYTNVGDPIVSNETHVAEGIIITEIIISLIAAVAVVVVGGVVESVVKRIVICVIIAIVVAVISTIIHVIIEKVIAEGVADNVPSISPMVKAATKQIQWPFSKSGEFELSDIKYNGALVFYGNI